MVFGMPRALFPQMAQETFGGPPGGGLALGMLNAGLAIGSLLGGLTGGWIHRIYRQGVAIVVAILVWGLSMALFGTTSVLWLAVLYLAIGGWSDLVSAVYRSTILQVRATDEMRGRIQGVFTVVVAGGPRVADLVHGVVADATSTAFAVTAGGIATMVLTVVAALLGRSLWNYDSRVRDPAASGPGT
jgi:MFS family permease